MKITRVRLTDLDEENETKRDRRTKIKQQCNLIGSPRS